MLTGLRSARRERDWKDGRGREEAAACRWRLPGPEDVMILGLIHVQDGVSWTTDSRLILVCNPKSFRSLTSYTLSLHPFQSSPKTDSRSRLVNMQQYANASDLLVCVCFISPGFHLHAVELSLPPYLLLSCLGSVYTRRQTR